MTSLTRHNLFDTAYDATTLAIFKSGYSAVAPWPGLVRQLRTLADRNGFNDDAEQSLVQLREAQERVLSQWATLMNPLSWLLPAPRHGRDEHD